ncbi:glucose-6-phosphate isomerase, partial [Enterococcus faecalis]
EIDFGNTKGFEGTLLAHTEAGVPKMIVKVPTMDAYSLDYVMYFFEIAVGISGYLNEDNPFDQPLVEAYKRNMFALLG